MDGGKYNVLNIDNPCAINKIVEPMENHQNIGQIRNQIADKDEKLARLFDDFANRIIQENGWNREPVYPQKLKPRRILPEDVLDKESEDGKINVIPSDFSNVCQIYCMCFAFDKWQSSKGFKGVSNKLIEYWFSCSKINKGTLIFTYAWDDVDFIQKYKKRFDQYSKEPEHTVAVIIITSRSISLQYLNSYK